MNFRGVKEIILSILLCAAFPNVSFCQANKETLIKEIEENIKTNRATMSQFLLIKYDAVHPETEFQQ